ncbi:hypothetical protein JQS43_01370 [Natronosporangium hydrolyticum]|uniref:Copper chaperone PCu(A)C n=1 Tax=Natronosporangium hydrolyticum TaxID=2811111 RepID=A0A895YLT5_9ACTN|nr:copper chaperone PCu(A)C [Natronosporangium hydrolyticum]QSB15060.1 hypothetical protein JQS43_01370 [Natronosporangium hydrolyticum]
MAATSGLLGLALVGCGATQNAATAQDRPSVPGVNVSDEGVSARNVIIEFAPEGYAVGENAPVRMALINETMEPVQLTSVSSPAAQEVTVRDAVTVTLPRPDPEDPAIADPAPTDPAAASQEVALGPEGFIDVTFELTGLTEELGLAAVVPLTLTFDNGAELSLMAPVAPPLQPEERGEHLDVGHGH